MASVRAQLLEALEEAGDDEGLGDTIERLKGGKFSFLLPMKGKKRRRVVESCCFCYEIQCLYFLATECTARAVHV